MCHGRTRAAAAAAAAVSWFSLAHPSGVTASRWDRTLSSLSRLQHSPNKQKNTRYSSRTRTAAVCDMSLLMREIAGAMGKTALLGSSAHGVFSLAPPTTMFHLRCAEMLWCGELVREGNRAIAVVDCFARSLSRKYSHV